MKYEETKVSIIIPCYNCAKLVGETLESLEKQTYTAFEVVCVNDGSKDNTLSVLEAYKEQGKLEMVIVDKENGGVSSARNSGINAANGEYLLFLDSDDIYHPEFVERMLCAITETDADVAYCKLNRDLNVVRDFVPQEKTPVLQTQTEAMHKLLFEMGSYGFYCYIYKKTVLEENNILFDENTKFGEDREFNWKYLCHTEKASWIDMPLYGYRINNESATRKGASWRKTDLLSAVKRIEQYMEEQKCDYYDTFASYMYARAMWAVAKTFSVAKDKALFLRLTKEYDVKTCMKRTAKDTNKLVFIASLLYLIHPMLFYYAVGIKG